MSTRGAVSGFASGESGRGNLLRVLFVVPHDRQSPGPRYRVFQFLPYYEANGLATRVLAVQNSASTERSILSPYAGRLRQLLHNAGVWMKLHVVFLRVIATMRRVDVLYLYRIPVPGWAAMILKRKRSRIVFDVDDALDQSELDAGILDRVRRWVLRKGMQHAVAVSRVTVASNSRNAKAVEAMGGLSVVVPTCIDLTRYPFVDRGVGPEKRTPVVGWIGTPSTLRYLAVIEEALLKLSEKNEFQVRLVGTALSPFQVMRAELRPWRWETEVEEIAAFDIGIMPMPDTPWTSGKAALKALQYGASGAPTVASCTETNVQILGADDGTLFASTVEGWVEALERLLGDAALRSELGRRGRARVSRLYSVESQVSRLLGVIHDTEADVGRQS